MPVFEFHHSSKEGSTLETTGPIVPVEVGIPVELEKHHAENGIPIPPAVAGYALIDTVAFASAVDESVFKRLGVAPLDSIRTSTPHGPGRSAVYPAKVSFPALELHGLPMERLVGCSLEWITAEGQEIIMLLGRDLLRHFLLVYNGKSSRVTVGL